jgi:phospholipid/cholesterol/gamma-HCH transport system substrate-binding protein
MAKRIISNIKLGIFVMGGLLFLILLLYMIGKNQHLWGSNYILKTRFSNVEGLKKGHNIRYAGIEAGTVKKVTILNDTLIEVEMYISRSMKSIIRKNAVVSIGTEGFVGNKIVNITPGKSSAPFAVEGDLLPSRPPLNTDDMLRTLSKTNNDIAIISEGLKTTVANINSSEALWQLLSDKSLPRDIRLSAANIRLATGRASGMIEEVNALVTDVKGGKGSLGAILKDSSFALDLGRALWKINEVAQQADSLASELKSVVYSVKNDINSGKGAANAMLKDSLIVIKLHQSLDNIEKGTAAFNEDMEALKHNFLLRGYFRKLEKQKPDKKNTVIRY